jgi:hypothetical protein
MIGSNTNSLDFQNSFGYNANGVFDLVINDFSLMVRHDFGRKDRYNISFILQRSINDAAGNRAEEDFTGCFYDVIRKDGDFLFSMAARSEWCVALMT